MVGYNQEDLQPHVAVRAAIKDPQDRILMQDQVKGDFWTIPGGKTQLNRLREGLEEELLQECNIRVLEARLLCSRSFTYERNGVAMDIPIYVFEVIRYEGEVRNNEPDKHRSQVWLSVDEIMQLPHLSDSTLMYLEHIGYKRPKRL